MAFDPSDSREKVSTIQTFIVLYYRARCLSLDSDRSKAFRSV